MSGAAPREDSWQVLCSAQAKCDFRCLFGYHLARSFMANVRSVRYRYFDFEVDLQTQTDNRH